MEAFTAKKFNDYMQYCVQIMLMKKVGLSKIESKSDVIEFWLRLAILINSESFGRIDLKFLNREISFPFTPNIKHINISWLRSNLSLGEYILEVSNKKYYRSNTISRLQRKITNCLSKFKLLSVHGITDFSEIDPERVSRLKQIIKARLQ